MHKISKGDVLGFLCQVGGIDKSDIGIIEIKDSESYYVLKFIKGKLIEKIKIIGYRAPSQRNADTGYAYAVYRAIGDKFVQISKYDFSIKGYVDSGIPLALPIDTPVTTIGENDPKCKKEEKDLNKDLAKILKRKEEIKARLILVNNKIKKKCFIKSSCKKQS